MTCACPCGCQSPILLDIDEPRGRDRCWDCMEICKEDEEMELEDLKHEGRMDWKYRDSKNSLIEER